MLLPLLRLAIERVYQFYMKIVLTFFVSVLFLQTGLSQNLEGKFFNCSDFIKFDHKNIEFDFYQGCLSVRYRGFGTYEFLNDYLLIDAGDYYGKKSFCKYDSSSSDSAILRISDIDGKEIPYANVVFIDNQGKVVEGFTVGQTGVKTLPKKMNIKKIVVSYLGSDPFILDYRACSDFNVHLAEGFILEGSKIVFHICSISNNSIELALLTTNFKKNKNSLRSLQKLNKHKSCGFDSKIFRK
jgi:hypothetical protein